MSPNPRARTDEELFADIDKLCADTDQWCSRFGFFPEEPVPGRFEALCTAEPVIITFVEPQPTLSAIMVQIYEDSLSPSSCEPIWNEEYATGIGRILEVPPIEYCGSEDEDEDDSTETVTLRRLYSINRSGEARG